MSFEIKPATRTGVKPLIGAYSPSGCGKTYSALLLARGLVGPSGKIVMIDTESGRGSLYADVLPGGYAVLEMREPFSPERYIEAVQAAESADVIVIDSMTHEWESIGGVQDMAMKVSQGRAQRYNKDWDGVIQFGDWKQPKLEHQKMMNKLLQCRCPVICCIRAKHKSKQVKATKEMADDGLVEQRQIGKTVVIKDEFASPVQAEDFIFEMTAHFEILPDHSIKLTKCSHPSLRDCFPSNGPITIEHGQKIAAWCQNASRPQTATRSIRGQLWDNLPVAAKGVGQSKTIQAETATKWLLGRGLIGDQETWGSLTDARMTGILEELAKVKAAA